MTKAYHSENLLYHLGTYTANKVNSTWFYTLILGLDVSTFQLVKGACSVIPFQGESALKRGAPSSGVIGYDLLLRKDISFCFILSQAYNDEFMFRLNGVRFDMLWSDSLYDTSSLDFQVMASREEEKLLQLIFDVGITDVMTVKIISAMKGSVIVSKTCVKQTIAGPNNSGVHFIEVRLFWLNMAKIRLKCILFLYIVAPNN